MFRFLIPVLALILSAQSFAAATADEDEGHYPVWWAASFELNSLEEIDRKWNSPFWPESPENKSYPATKGSGQEIQTAYIDSCASREQLLANGYVAKLFYEPNRTYMNFAIDCDALDLLKTAMPSRVNFVQDFAFGQDALEILPAILNMAISCGRGCDHVEANKRRISWDLLEPDASLTVNRGTLITVNSVGWEVSVGLLARADFNNDGLEDLLVVSSGWATKGTDRLTRLYTLTRNAPGGVLWAIGAEKQLCENYICDVNYDRLDAIKKTPEDEAADKEPYPVWWQTEYLVKSLADIPIELSRRYADGKNGPVTFIKTDEEVRKLTGYLRDKYEIVNVYNCNEALQLSKAGFKPFATSFSTYSMIHCQILTALQQAIPAKKSFLRSFELDKAGLSALPPLPVPQDICRQQETDAPPPRQAKSLGEYFSGAKIVLEAFEDDKSVEKDEYSDGYYLRVTRSDSTVFLSVMARGDFDLDGQDDIVISMDSSHKDYLFNRGRYYFLTRDGPNKALRRLDIYPFPWSPECVNTNDD